MSNYWGLGLKWVDNELPVTTFYIDYIARIGMNVKNNDFTLYDVMLMCGPALQMETSMMYDNVESVIFLSCSTASCSDCNPVDRMKEQLEILAEERLISPTHCAVDTLLLIFVGGLK
jgi:hypothetical protein